MKKITVPDVDNPNLIGEVTYWQASRPLTDHPIFDDNINSVKCGVDTSTNLPIAVPSLCYDHLTIDRHFATGEDYGDYKITAVCSWTGSEPWAKE